MLKILNALAKRIGRKQHSDGPLSVDIGGERIAVHPLGLKDTIQFMLLLAPYVGSFDRHRQMLADALQKPDGPTRHGFLSAIFTAMAGEMGHAPGDLTRAVALLLDREPEWVARHGMAEEIVRAIPVLDAANNFGSLFVSLRALGLTAAEKSGDNGTDGPAD